MPPKRKAAAVDGAASAPKRRQRLREWMWTSFSAELVGAPAALLAALAPLVAYAMFQREICPETKRPHLQGYLALPTPKTYTAVQAMLGDAAAHMEPTRGTSEEASAYCCKEDTRDPAPDSGPFTTGTLPDGQGKRNDLLEVKALIDAGEPDAVVADTHFGTFVRYHRGLSIYRALKARPRASQTQCVVYWGPPGSGKTRAAGDWDPSSTYWLPRPSGSTAWWDGYAGHRVVVLDEFYGWLRRDLLQRLIDRTPIRVECKGGTINFDARWVIFTSNVPPEHWYKNAGLGAMQRRLEEPIGAVCYVGNAEYPTAESYRRTLPDPTAGAVHWLRDSDAVSAAGLGAEQG